MNVAQTKPDSSTIGRNSQPFLSVEQLDFDKDRATFISNILSLILHLLRS